MPHRFVKLRDDCEPRLRGRQARSTLAPRRPLCRPLRSGVSTERFAGGVSAKSLRRRDLVACDSRSDAANSAASGVKSGVPGKGGATPLISRILAPAPSALGQARWGSLPLVERHARKTKRKRPADAVAPAAFASAANSIDSVRQLPYALKVAATQQRIEARISADEKRLLEDAAQRRGMTLTAFVLSTAHDAAVRTLETAHVVELTRQDQQRFVDTLLNPPAPSARLRAAATDYREHTSRATSKSRR